MKKPVVLCILDGYAHNPNPRGNAVFAAKKPTMDALWQKYPHTELITFGQHVGLPDGQMGNSEVGHLNIGAGRVVSQDLARINKDIRDGSFKNNLTLLRCLNNIKADQALHLIGLTSKGGVHSSLEHLKALITCALEKQVGNIVIHAITDGRDRPPTASLKELSELEEFIAKEKSRTGSSSNICIATIVGRYYAMDRDHRWARTNKADALFIDGKAEHDYDSLRQALTRRTENEFGRGDEFIEPCTIKSDFPRSPFIRTGDSIIFYNFRADRMRQICELLAGYHLESRGALENKPQDLKIFPMTEYEAHLWPENVLYPDIRIDNHLAKVLEKNALKQLHIAETEKYAHVTYFFNGGEEAPCAGETRKMIPSPKDVPTYDKKPEMSAPEVATTLIAALESGEIDVAIVNFANCDMVGHTGVFEAAVKAVETVDRCLGQLYNCVKKLGGILIVTADHGNADQMIDYETGEVHTFHTLHPVPFIIADEELLGAKLRSGGALCDIAPTMLKLLQIEKPKEMTGTSLF